MEILEVPAQQSLVSVCDDIERINAAIRAAYGPRAWPRSSDPRVTATEMEERLAFFSKQKRGDHATRD